MKYVALLRGINVGGNNKVAMSTLKTSFEALRFSDVKTYINSGNVIFQDDTGRSKSELIKIIEERIAADFGFDVMVMLRSRDEIAAIMKQVPEDWTNAGEIKCDVMFLGDSIDSPSVITQLNPKPDIETLTYLPGVVLWRIERHNYGKSKVPKMIGTDLYKNMTLRNVNTLRKLHALLAD